MSSIKKDEDPNILSNSTVMGDVKITGNYNSSQQNIISSLIEEMKRKHINSILT